ncbi:MAG TPA: hypothetical protein VGJ24_01135 [Nocardioides sp.]
MATTRAPGTGIGPGDAGKHGRRSAVIAAVALAGAAIVVPFALHGAHHSGAEASPAAPVAQPSPAPAVHHAGTNSRLGSQADLPPLLPSGRPTLQDGAQVRVGDITEGTLRHTPGGWQVLVRWDGRLQPLPTQGPVALGATSWVSASGALYTRVPTDTPGRFRVFTWDPEGGTAYTPPALVSSELGQVCFDKTFTAFGDCRVTE